MEYAALGQHCKDMESTEIIIKPEEIQLLAKEGEKFIFKPEAEEQLYKLVKLKEMIDSTLEEVKTRIAEAGEGINPNFRGVIGDRVRCIYRAYGSKYGYDWQKKDRCMPFLKEKTAYTVDGARVDAYVKEVGELPDGIVENDRGNKLSIVLKDDEEKQLLE